MIVNVGEWAVVRPYKHFAAYFTSKAAIPGNDEHVRRRTRHAESECAGECGTARASDDAAGIGPPAERQASIDGTLVKREGSPANVAKAVLSFLDNDFITGACLTVDGGRSVFANELQ